VVDESINRVERLVLGDIGEVVEDEEIEPIEATDGGLEVKLAVSNLQLLDEIGGASKEDAPFVSRSEPGRLLPPSGSFRRRAGVNTSEHRK
jgi:hypothetical protein